MCGKAHNTAPAPSNTVNTCHSANVTTKSALGFIVQMYVGLVLGFPTYFMYVLSLIPGFHVPHLEVRKWRPSVLNTSLPWDGTAHEELCHFKAQV